MTPPTPTLAEIEARHNLRLSEINRDGLEPCECGSDRWCTACNHDDIAHLLRLVRERDARLAEIAREVEDNMPPRGVKTPVTAIRETLRRIYNIAKGDAA